MPGGWSRDRRPQDGSGVTAWKTSGADLRRYLENRATDNHDDRAARRVRHRAIRDDVAHEEAEAAENALALDVPLHLRLDERLRELAAADHVPTSALVRRLLRQTTGHRADALSTADVERIARRIARQEIDLRS